MNRNTDLPDVERKINFINDNYFSLNHSRLASAINKLNEKKKLTGIESFTYKEIQLTNLISSCLSMDTEEESSCLKAKRLEIEALKLELSIEESALKEEETKYGICEESHTSPLYPTWWDKVYEFQKVFNSPNYRDTPLELSKDRVDLRASFMREEVEEFEEAESLVDQVDAIIDIIYFAIGTMVEMGVRPEPFFDIVHEANMNKLWSDGKPRLKNGKLIKPEGWETPEPKMIQELRSLNQQ